VARAMSLQRKQLQAAGIDTERGAVIIYKYFSNLN
jgi:hypothetical protein